MTAAPSTYSRRRAVSTLAGSAAALALLTVAGPSRAATYPSRPVRLLVPWPAGGATDVGARTFAQRFAGALGGTVTVENKAGATGMIGTAAAATSPPDGHTLLLASAETHAINPYTFEKLPYDPVKDFIPIGAFATNPYALVARADFAPRNTRELVDEVRRSPGKYNYGSAGTGSASQIVMEMFKQAESMDIPHVPFQGEAPAVTALMGGQIDFMILPVGRAMALRTGGKIRAYAVTQPTRFEGMPDVPTMGEEGFRSIAIANWFSLMAPAGTPEPIVRQLAEALRTTVASPETTRELARIGLGPFPPMTQAQFAEFVGSERTRWRATIEQAKIRADR